MVVVHFGSNGWHGRFDDVCTSRATYSVAQNLGACFKRHGYKRVLVGYDTRVQSKTLAYVVVATLFSQGMHVCLTSSYTTTPALGWMAAHTDFDAAIMLTGADYAASYGGMVLRGRDSGLIDADIPQSLDGEVEQELPTEIRELLSHSARLLFDLVETIDEHDRYIKALWAYDEHLLKRALSLHANVYGVQAKAQTNGFVDIQGTQTMLPRLKVVVDTMGGAASMCAAQVIEHLGCEVIPLRNEPTSDFFGAHPRPIKPWTKPAYQAIAEHGADLAVVFDGDGMRMSLIDESGHHVPLHLIGPFILDYLVRICAQEGRVVTTQASSVRITRQADLLGCEYTRVPVGFYRVYDEILEGDVVLTCDEYGGVCVPAFGRERDAVLAAILCIRLIQHEGIPLSVLQARYRNELGNMDYTRRDIELDAAHMQTFATMLPGLNPKTIAGDTPCEISHADGLHMTFKDGSWVMLRPSRTQMSVRIYVEAPNLTRRQELMSAACALTKSKL